MKIAFIAVWGNSTVQVTPVTKYKHFRNVPPMKPPFTLLNSLFYVIVLSNSCSSAIGITLNRPEKAPVALTLMSNTMVFRQKKPRHLDKGQNEYDLGYVVAYPLTN